MVRNAWQLAVVLVLLFGMPPVAAASNDWLAYMLTTGAANTYTANALGGCSEDALRCSGSVLEVCTGNKWVTQQNCAPGYCAANACHAAVPLTCTDGAKQCKDATTSQVCSGGVWVDDTSCAPGTTCQVTGPGTISCVTPPCSNGAQRCADSTQAQLCVNGAWTNWQTCPAGQQCSNGNCVSSASYCDGTVADSCVDTQWLKHCDVPTNTWVQQNCDAQGKVCRNGVCADRITPLGCNPATDGAYCSGAGGRTYCNANGQWATENCAGGQVCSNGACVSQAGAPCTSPAGNPGDKTCADESELLICQNGQWAHYSYCAAGAICQNNACGVNTGCANPTGSQNDRSCKDASTPQVCDLGNWVPATACASGQVCQGGNCITQNVGGGGGGGGSGNGGGSGGSGGSTSGGGSVPPRNGSVTPTGCVAKPGSARTDTEKSGALCRTCTYTSYTYSCPVGVKAPDATQSETKTCSSWTSCAPQVATGTPSVAAPAAPSQPVAQKSSLDTLYNQYGPALIVVPLLALIAIGVLFYITFGKKPE